MQVLCWRFVDLRCASMRAVRRLELCVCASLAFAHHLFVQNHILISFRLVNCVEYGTRVKLFEVKSTVQNVLDADFQAV